MISLNALMQEHLPEGGVVIPGGRDPHIELIEVAMGQVWMSVEPANRPDYETLLSGLDDAWRGMGIGSASMDAALFRCSPGGENEPVRERMIGGRRFIYVARPGERSRVPGGMMEVMVNKSHVIGFEAGRRLTILSLREGDFVEVVGGAGDDRQLPLPEGAKLRAIELKAPWIVPLPDPTRTLWHFGAGVRSFQGPVTVPAP